MAKTGPNFKLSKTFKRTVALMKGASNDQRNGWKRMFIDAQHTAETAVVQSKKRSREGNNSVKQD